MQYGTRSLIATASVVVSIGTFASTWLMNDAIAAKPSTPALQPNDPVVGRGVERFAADLVAQAKERTGDLSTMRLRVYPPICTVGGRRAWRAKCAAIHAQITAALSEAKVRIIDLKIQQAVIEEQMRSQGPEFDDDDGNGEAGRMAKATHVYQSEIVLHPNGDTLTLTAGIAPATSAEAMAFVAMEIVPLPTERIAAAPPRRAEHIPSICTSPIGRHLPMCGGCCGEKDGTERPDAVTVQKDALRPSIPHICTYESSRFVPVCAPYFRNR